MDCSLPGSSVHRILQARILEWVSIPFSRGSSGPRDWTLVSSFAGGFFTVWDTSEAPSWPKGSLKLTNFIFSWNKHYIIYGSGRIVLESHHGTEPCSCGDHSLIQLFEVSSISAFLLVSKAAALIEVHFIIHHWLQLYWVSTKCQTSAMVMGTL